MRLPWPFVWHADDADDTDFLGFICVNLFNLCHLRAIFFMYCSCENALKDMQKSQNSACVKYPWAIVNQYAFFSISDKNYFGQNLPFLPTMKLPDRFPSVSEGSALLCQYCRASLFSFRSTKKRGLLFFLWGPRLPDNQTRKAHVTHERLLSCPWYAFWNCLGFRRKNKS